MPDQLGELVQLESEVSGVHPDYRGLSPRDLHGALEAELALLDTRKRLDVLKAISWILGGARGGERLPLLRPGAQPGDHSLEVLDDERIVAEVEEQIEHARKHAQLPLVRVVKPTED